MTRTVLRLMATVLVLTPVIGAGDAGSLAGETITQSGPLAGEMQYMADAARFRECLTGRSYPIAMESDYLALERAYLKAVPQPGALLYVTFDGAIEQRPKMEGDGSEPTVVVRRFIGVWPNEKCERAMADAPLTNTYWRIVRLGADAVSAIPDRREPHVLLRREGERNSYAATIGCNSMGGDFVLNGDTITFSPPASTMMACEPPLDELEKKLGDTLAKAKRWRIQGNTLELRDPAGTTVALLEAVYL